MTWTNEKPSQNFTLQCPRTAGQSYKMWPQKHQGLYGNLTENSVSGQDFSRLRELYFLAMILLVQIFPSEVEHDNTLPSNFNPDLVTRVLFISLFVVIGFNLCIFLVIFDISKASQACLGFLNTRSLWCTLRRKCTGQITIIQACCCEFNVNESTIHNE